MKEGGIKGRLKLFRQFIRCCESETVSWRPSVAEEVCGKRLPPLLAFHSTSTPSTQLKKYNSLPGDEVCIVCAKYQQLGSAKPLVIV